MTPLNKPSKQYKPKKPYLNIYGWAADKSFGHAFRLPFIWVNRSQYRRPKKIGSISVGRDQFYTIGLNIIFKRK